MANALIDPFQPMQQAWGRMNQSIMAGPQMQGQRLANKLAEIKLEQLEGQQQQQRDLKNYLAQGQQPTSPMVGQYPPEYMQSPNQQYLAKELEFWKANDPAKYRDLMSGYMDYTLKLAKLNSKGAEQFWQGLTGEEISIAKDEETETLDIVSDEGMKLSGTAEDIRAFMDQSSAAQSPEQLMKLAVESGISLELPGEKPPSSAMAAYLRQNPDATPDEIALFAQKLKGKGISMTLPDGTVVEIGGPSGGPEMTSKTKGAIEGKLTAGREQLARMETIVKEFKPEYQEVGTRLSTAWTGMKARLGMDIAPEDINKLTDFKKFQRKAIENINLYIKEMTGAQMSEKEASRLRLAQPDPGESWWKGDDPITFKAKMDDVQLMTRAAVARYEYYRNKGLTDAQVKNLISTDKAIPLEEIAAKME
jgi:hypothetical protein